MGVVRDAVVSACDGDERICSSSFFRREEETIDNVEQSKVAWRAASLPVLYTSFRGECQRYEKESYPNGPPVRANPDTMLAELLLTQWNLLRLLAIMPSTM